MSTLFNKKNLIKLEDCVLIPSSLNALGSIMINSYVFSCSSSLVAYFSSWMMNWSPISMLFVSSKTIGFQSFYIFAWQRHLPQVCWWSQRHLPQVCSYHHLLSPASMSILSSSTMDNSWIFFFPIHLKWPTKEILNIMHGQKVCTSRIRLPINNGWDK